MAVCTQRERHAEKKAKIKVIYLQVKASKAPEAVREGLERVHPQNPGQSLKSLISGNSPSMRDFFFSPL